MEDTFPQEYALNWTVIIIILISCSAWDWNVGVCVYCLRLTIGKFKKAVFLKQNEWVSSLKKKKVLNKIYVESLMSETKLFIVDKNWTEES